MKGLLQQIKENWHKIYFILAVMMVSFAYGVMVDSFQLFPYKLLKAAKSAAQDLLKDDNYKHYLGIRPEKLIYPSRFNGNGVTVHIPDKVQSGYTFLTSLWDNTLGMNLIDMNGTVVHKWRVSFANIFPESQNPDDLGDWDTHIHGAILYPNGDVIFNFEYGGLVRIDQCADIIWKLPYSTHHSIFEDNNGDLWVPGRRIHKQPIKRFPILEPDIEEDFILKISPAGKIIKEISLLDVIYKSEKDALLTANGLVSTVRSGKNITHLNDIDILDKAIASQFPLFAPGDIMVSFRNLNLIVIIDPVTEKIKWSMTGPFIRQHDPDFLENGKISVFDNRMDDKNGAILGGSRILSIDPITRQVHTVYKGDSQNPFFTDIMGKHQYLPNGNILIAEALAGRAFEITPSGEIVWTYINKLNDNEVYVIEQATRYSKQYVTFLEESKKCQ